MAEKPVEDATVAAAQKLGFKEIKPLQLEVITATAEGHDVFAVLRNGYRKTCFATLPYVYDQLQPSGELSIVIVLSPLTAIMKDQVSLLCAA